MIRRPPRSTRTDTLFPYTTLFRSLGHQLNAIHVFGGYPVEPVDIHASVRHLEALRDILTMSDKALHAYSLGRERIEDGIEMVRIARGVSREQMAREPSLFRPEERRVGKEGVSTWRSRW